VPRDLQVPALNDQPDHRPYGEASSRVIGILQGRLTQPWNGELQCFPRDRWEGEFVLARSCGFNAIELIAEASHNPANPIGGWQKAALRAFAADRRRRRDSVC